MSLAKVVDRIAELWPQLTEVGVVFEPGLDLVLADGDKLGLPKQLVIELAKFTKSTMTTTEDTKTETATTNKWLVRLLCNGDDAAAWSFRKRALMKDASSLQNELKFNALVLGKQPKSHGAWEHRRFVCTLVMQSPLASAANAATEFLFAEIRVCERACVRHPRTYYAWAHRAWAVGWMDSAALARERFQIKTWLSQNQCDASAAQHYSRVLKLYLDRDVESVLDASKRVRVLVQDLEWASALLLQHKSDAIWLVRKTISHRLLWELSQLVVVGDGAALASLLRTVELDAILTHVARFEAYEWALRLGVTADTLLQVLFDELACAMRAEGGVGRRVEARWLMGELAELLLLPTVAASSDSLVNAVLVSGVPEEREVAVLVHQLVFGGGARTTGFAELSADAFAHSPALFGALLARFDKVLAAGRPHTFATSYVPPDGSLEAFQQWIRRARRERTGLHGPVLASAAAVVPAAYAALLQRVQDVISQ